MTDTADLIYREIEIISLPKYAKAILEKLDRMVAWQNTHENTTDTIHLFKNDFDRLSKALKLRNQDINERTYNGYRLGRA